MVGANWFPTDGCMVGLNWPPIDGSNVGSGNGDGMDVVF